MQAAAKVQHHRKHKSGKAVKIIAMILVIGVILAVTVGLLVLMNNPAYEGGR